MSEGLPDVTLRPVCDDDHALLERWMQVPDVFAFLDYEEPPSRFEIRAVLLTRSVDLLIIELASKPVGFFIVYTRGAKRTGTREFDIAVAEPEARQGGAAKAAIRAFERWAFEEQGLKGVYANIFPDNRPCLELVRACAWPLTEVDAGGIEFRGQAVDVVYTHMTPELRPEAIKKRDF